MYPCLHLSSHSPWSYRARNLKGTNFIGTCITWVGNEGPIQPINAELAVDVTYPSDETAVESVQQIGGNLVSALLVPIAEIGARQDYQLLPNNANLASDIRGDVILLAAIAIVTLQFFSSFDAPLKRSKADESTEQDLSDEKVIDAKIESNTDIKARDVETVGMLARRR